MADQWQIKSYTYANCNCEANCGCQFNLPSSHGYCQFVQGGRIVEGHFNTTPLSGLHWAWMIVWPGEVAEGGGSSQIVIDERADDAQREALEKIISGQVSVPGSSHFAIFHSMCDTLLPTLYLPIEFDMNIEHRTARLRVRDLIEASGEPMIDHEETAPDPDGNEVWLLTTKVPLRDENGDVTGLVGIGRNITNRKRAEQELLAAKEAADSANRKFF